MWTKRFTIGTVNAEVGSDERGFTTALCQRIGWALGDTCATADTLIEIDDGQPLIVIHTLSLFFVIN